MLFAKFGKYCQSGSWEVHVVENMKKFTQRDGQTDERMTKGNQKISLIKKKQRFTCLCQILIQEWSGKFFPATIYM